MAKATKPTQASSGKLPPNRLIRASAGTGKTYQLSTRYLQLLARDASVDQILATTFTRKAAGEILQRIVQRLTRAASDLEAAQDLASAVERPELTRDDFRRLLRRMTHQLHRVRVSTFDSFFARLARTFSLELGLSPGWQVISPTESRRQRSLDIQQLLADKPIEGADELLHLLHPGEARRGVADELDQLIASYYERYLQAAPEAWHAELSVANGQQPWSVEHLRKVLDQLAAAGAASHKTIAKAVGTFCEAVRAQSEDDHSALSSWSDLIGKGVAVKVITGGAKFSRVEIPDEIARIIWQIMSHVGRVIHLQLARRASATGQLISEYHAVHHDLNELHQSLSFAEVVHYLQRPPWEHPRDWSYRLDAKFDHLLFDEFQDTSWSQWFVLRPLVEHIVAQPHSCTMLCVGDVKQAIYGWRGGDSRIFKQFESGPLQLELSTLDESRRSAPAVIEAVNDVFSRLPELDKCENLLPTIRRFVESFPRHTTVHAGYQGHVALIAGPQIAGSSSRSASSTAANGDDDADEPEKDEEFLKYVADRVAGWHREHPQQSLAVLLRTNKFATKLVYWLKRHGLDVSDEGRSSLIDAAAVQLILCALRLVDHPGDSASLYRLVHSPWGADLGLPLPTEGLRANAMIADRRVSDFIIKTRRNLIESGYGTVVSQWIDQLKPWCTDRDRRRLERFGEIAFSYEIDATLRTTDFIDRVLDDQVSDPTAAPIRVMTIHASKGLQFDVVVLPELHCRIVGMTPKLLFGPPEPDSAFGRVIGYPKKEFVPVLPQPLRQIVAHHYDVVAEDALAGLYVAMTRAIHSLQIIIPADPVGADEPKISANLASLVRSAVAPGTVIQAGEVIYETGRADWQATPSEPIATHGVVPPLPTLQLAPSAKGLRGLISEAPSSREGGAQATVGELLQRAPAARFEWGQLVHAWLESIAWLEDGLPDRDKLRSIAQRHRIDTDLEERIERFERLLNAGPLRDVLSRSVYEPSAPQAFRASVRRELEKNTCRLEVRNEVPIASVDNDRLISGNVDRLVLWRHADRIVAAEIIDYKTDTVATDEQRVERTQFYAPQLDAYRQAVQSMLRLPAERVATRLVFVELPSNH
ncbi:MAG: UvrD-helicase domain-containing protein [Pirellulales bacterium]